MASIHASPSQAQTGFVTLACRADWRVIAGHQALQELLGIDLPHGPSGFLLDALTPESRQELATLAGQRKTLDQPIIGQCLSFCDRQGCTVLTLATLHSPDQQIAPDHALNVVLMRADGLEERLRSLRVREHEIEARETRHARMADRAHEVMVEFDATGALTFASPTAARVLGRSTAQLQGQSLQSLLHPDDTAPYQSLITKLVATRNGIEQTLDMRVKGGQGQWLWVEARPTVQWQATPGQATAILDCWRDISDRKSRENEIEAGRAFLNSAAKLAKVGGWEVDFVANRMHWTQSVESILEPRCQKGVCTPAQFIQTFFDPAAGQAFKDACENVLFSREEFFLELPVITGSGDVKWVEFFGQPRLYEGEVCGVIGALLDITAKVHSAAVLAEAAIEAEKASEAKSQFLANMSHEIRTPLNGVLGVASALAKTNLDARQNKMIDIIMSSGRTLSTLLNEILDLSKMEAGHLALDPVPTSPNEIGEIVSALFEQSAKAKGIGFAMHSQIPSDLRIQADPIRVKQILSNLLSNAIKFTQIGQVDLEIALEARDANRVRVRFSVRDTGPGFDEETRQRLFGRFVQADATTTRTFGGTGLGLAISRNLAELMGGSVTCQSTPGVGSVFVFEAPFDCVADAPETPSAALPYAADAFKSCNILAVDDNETNRSVLALLLEDHVKSLTFAADGAEAVRCFSTGRFDVILMDTQMPVLNGLEATRQIRQLEAQGKLPRTPVITLSANVMPEQLAEAAAAGADDFVGKPIEVRALFDTLARWHQPHAQASTSPTLQLPCAS